MFVIHLLSPNFVFQTNALVNAVRIFGFYLKPACDSKPLFFQEYDGSDSGEAVKTKLDTIELLTPLITSKNRLKLLTRFLLNQSVDGYLQGLSKELDENTNSIRLELNRLEKAGLLAPKTKGRRKLFSVNTSHSLTLDLTSIVRKYELFMLWQKGLPLTSLPCGRFGSVATWRKAYRASISKLY